MAITVKHKFVSAIPDAGDPNIVQPSNWNDTHELTGLGTMAEQNANAVAITGGTISGVTIPASNVTGTLGVPNGGTGATTLTGYVKGNGTSAMTASATVPSTDITGLGTMSAQNANSVNITGGSISGTTVAGYVTTTTTITAGTGLTGGGDLSANRTLAIANTAVTAASYGSASKTLTATVNAQGQLTALADTNIAITNTQVSGLGTASTKDAGAALGVATLDASGKVPVSELPAAVLGALSYQGTWDASTNTPTLTSSVGTKGYYYVVSVAGSTNLNGITDWLVGDWAVYNGTAWQKVDNTDAVTSVNGFTGAVVLTTTNVAEGTSLYYTDARARAAISAGTGISYASSTGVVTNAAPDQTVVLNAGTGISTSGTYPNFTITNTSPSLGGDVVGPTGATDNAVARFDTTTGKLIQNSLVIIGDTGSVTGVNALTAESLTVNNNATLGSSNTDTLEVNARITTDLEPNTDAAKDIGTSGRNWRDGFFSRNLQAEGKVVSPHFDALNSAGGQLRNSSGTAQLQWGGGGGNNVSVDVAININPANAQVDLSPTGTGTVRIAPATAGTMNNMVIGGTTPLAGSFTDLSVTGTTSFDGSQGTAGQVLTSAGTGATPTWTTPTTGTVTSVTGTSPVVSSGGATPAISLAANYGDTQNPYDSKTANFVLAAPNGSAGAPSFRAIAAADIPTLNQNTTGTASNVTGTVAIANGGTGETTRQAAIDALAGAVTSGKYLRGNGTDVVMSAIQAADVPTLNQNTTGTASNVTGTVAIANGGTGQTTATAAFNALNPMTTTGDIIYEASATTAARLPIGTTGQVLTVAGGIPSWSTPSAGTGTVTSVAATVPSFLSVSGSPITTSGTLAIGYSGTALPQANGGTGTTAIGLCKGWVNFSGSSGAVNDSFNVSSVTRTTTGVFIVNLTNALPSTNYARITCPTVNTSNTSGLVVVSDWNGGGFASPTTSAYYISFYTLAGLTLSDPTLGYSAVFSS